ncbi:MAG: hydrogenase maturation nickel metallochaperone HypA [Lachnospiraceae bacterium]|nr:hydrogenase maturation nickel metallochaperone HypA [Lachnospiraceae bacterium]
MHEMSYCIRLVNIALDAAKENDINHVSRITVDIGQMTGVLPHLLKSCYEQASKGTILEGSEIVINEIKTTALCLDCDREYIPSKDNNYSCPDCKSINSKIIRGREVSLVNIIDDEE